MKAKSLCDSCEHFLSCKVKFDITTVRDIVKRFEPPFEGCEMTINSLKDFDFKVFIEGKRG